MNAPLSAGWKRTLAGVWAFRSKSEREATERFRRLARELGETGGSEVAIDVALEAVDDETRHIDLCSAMADHFDPSPRRKEPVAALPVGPTDWRQKDRLLWEIMAFCAITESVNASLMHAIHATCRDAVVKEAVRAILKDEMKHSRLGWAHLAQETAARDCSFLSEALPHMLEQTARDELFSSPAPSESDLALITHGELPQSHRRDLFVSTIEDVVFPGLETLGIGTAPARSWLGVKKSKGLNPTA